MTNNGNATIGVCEDCRKPVGLKRLSSNKKGGAFAVSKTLLQQVFNSIRGLAEPGRVRKASTKPDGTKEFKIIEGPVVKCPGCRSQTDRLHWIALAENELGEPRCTNCHRTQAKSLEDDHGRAVEFDVFCYPATMAAVHFVLSTFDGVTEVIPDSDGEGDKEEALLF